MSSEVPAKLSRSEGHLSVFTAASQVRALELDPMIDASRVLVVDDEENITELLSTALRYIGYDVAVAHTGREAIDRTVSFRAWRGSPGSKCRRQDRHLRVGRWRSRSGIAGRPRQADAFPGAVSRAGIGRPRREYVRQR